MYRSSRQTTCATEGRTCRSESNARFTDKKKLKYNKRLLCSRKGTMIAVLDKKSKATSRECGRCMKSKLFVMWFREERNKCSCRLQNTFTIVCNHRTQDDRERRILYDDYYCCLVIISYITRSWYKCHIHTHTYNV